MSFCRTLHWDMLGRLKRHKNAVRFKRFTRWQSRPTAYNNWFTQARKKWTDFVEMERPKSTLKNAFRFFQIRQENVPFRLARKIR